MSNDSLEQLLARLKGGTASSGSNLAQVFPPERIEKIKKRELARFKNAQDKKWRNWLESVSK